MSVYPIIIYVGNLNCQAVKNLMTLIADINVDNYIIYIT